jgi:putative intracellular protease/amidase
MDKPLAGKTVAILVANGFQEIDMTEPQRALLGAGAAPKLVSPEQGLVNGWHGKAWGHYFPVDVNLSSALAADFDGLLVPGGERGVDKLTGTPHTTRFIRGFMDGGKPVAVIGRAAQLLADAERVAGRTISADEDLAERLREAGADLSEDPVTADGNLLTAVDGAEVEAIQQAILRLFTEITNSLADAA